MWYQGRSPRPRFPKKTQSPRKPHLYWHESPSHRPNHSKDQSRTAAVPWPTLCIPPHSLLCRLSTQVATHGDVCIHSENANFTKSAQFANALQLAIPVWAPCTLYTPEEEAPQIFQERLDCHAQLSYIKNKFFSWYVGCNPMCLLKCSTCHL